MTDSDIEAFKKGENKRNKIKHIVKHSWRKTCPHFVAFHLNFLKIIIFIGMYVVDSADLEIASEPIAPSPAYPLGNPHEV